MAFLCLGTVLLAEGCGKSSSQQKAQRAIGKADTYFKAGLFKDALAQYQEALASDPSDATTHLKAGLSYEALGLNRDALTSYEEAIRNEPRLERAHHEKASLLIKEGKLPEAEGVVKGLESNPRMDWLRWFLKGEIAKAKNDWPQAIECYLEADKARPGSHDTVEGLAFAYQKAGKVDDAARVLSSHFKRDPDDTSIAAQLASLYAAQGDTLKAVDVLVHVVEKQPALSGPRAMLANLYLDSGKPEDAEREAKEAAKLNPDDAMGLFVMGRLALRKGDAQQALKDIEAALQRRPGDETFRKGLREAQVAAGEVVDKVKAVSERIDKEGQTVPLLLELAEASLFQGESEKTLSQIESVYRQDPDNQSAHILEALSFLCMGRIGSASRSLEAVKGQGDARVLAIHGVVSRDSAALAKAAGALSSASATELWGGYFKALGFLYFGKLGDGLDQLDSLVRKNENFGPPIYEMARVYEEINEPHLALAIYQRLMETFPDSAKPQLLAARTLVRIGHNERAKVLLDSVLKKQPQSEQALFFLGTIYLQEKDFPAAVKVFQSLVEASRENPLGLLFHRSVLAKTLVFSKQYKQALAEYETLIQAYPGQSAAYIEKCMAQLAQSQDKEALATCQRGIAAASDTSVLKVVESVAMQQLGQAEEGLGVLEKELSGPDCDETLKKRLVPIHASMLVSGKQYGKAREIIESSGYPPKLVEFFLASIDLSEKQKSDLGKLGLGLLFTFYQWPDAALEVYGNLAQKNGQDKLLIAYLGEAQAAANRNEDAFKTYSKGLALDKNDGYFLEKCALLAAKLGRAEEAIKDFSSALALAPENSALHFQLAAIYEAQNLNDDAIAAYRTVVKLNNDPKLVAGACNNLAWLLSLEEKKRGEALEFAKKAFEALPPNPRTGLKDGNVVDTLGWVYFLSGNNEEGRKYIEQALRVLPNHPTINYHLGRIYEELGNPKAAIIQYGKAVDFDPNFKEADDARARSTRLMVSVGKG
jgi:tetratricopeptide (TPR) repeat protein